MTQIDSRSSAATHTNTQAQMCNAGTTIDGTLCTEPVPAEYVGTGYSASNGTQTGPSVRHKDASHDGSWVAGRYMAQSAVATQAGPGLTCGSAGSAQNRELLAQHSSSSAKSQLTGQPSKLLQEHLETSRLQQPQQEQTVRHACNGEQHEFQSNMLNTAAVIDLPQQTSDVSCCPCMQNAGKQSCIASAHASSTISSRMQQQVDNASGDRRSVGSSRPPSAAHTDVLPESTVWEASPIQEQELVPLNPKHLPPRPIQPSGMHRSNAQPEGQHTPRLARPSASHARHSNGGHSESDGSVSDMGLRKPSRKSRGSGKRRTRTKPCRPDDGHAAGINGHLSPLLDSASTVSRCKSPTPEAEDLRMDPRHYTLGCPTCGHCKLHQKHVHKCSQGGTVGSRSAVKSPAAAVRVRGECRATTATRHTAGRQVLNQAYIAGLSGPSAQIPHYARPTEAALLRQAGAST
jgi:hypothetical protein